MRPSPMSVPHPTWLCTHTDMHADRVPPWTMKQFTFISWWDHRSSASLDSAIGTVFCKLLSVFAILYTLRMSKFYMPTLINHRNNSKTAPIRLYFVRPSSWGVLHQRCFLAWSTPTSIRDTRLHTLTSFVHVSPLDMLTTSAVSWAVNCERV